METVTISVFMFAILAILVGSTRLKRKKKIEAICSNTKCPLTFQFCLFFYWTFVALANVWECVDLAFPLCLFQSDKVVNCLWEICLFFMRPSFGP